MPSSPCDAHFGSVIAFRVPAAIMQFITNRPALAQEEEWTNLDKTYTQGHIGGDSICDMICSTSACVFAHVHSDQCELESSAIALSL